MVVSRNLFLLQGLKKLLLLLPRGSKTLLMFHGSYLVFYSGKIQSIVTYKLILGCHFLVLWYLVLSLE